MAPQEQDVIPSEPIPSPSFKIVDKALELPIVNDAVHAAAIAYLYANQLETVIGDLLAKAEHTISPGVSESKTSPVFRKAAQLDRLACNGLDQVTSLVPALKMPTGELVSISTSATIDIANTLTDFLLKFMAVRFLITVFIYFLGIVIKCLTTFLRYQTDQDVVNFFKSVINLIKKLKIMVVEIVRTNTVITEEMREEIVNVTDEVVEENDVGINEKLELKPKED